MDGKLSRKAQRAASPSDEDRRLASESRQILETAGTRPQGVRLQLLDENASHEAFTLPAPAVRMLSEVLTEMARGNSVMLLPEDATLTTQEAADILNVSRPFIVGLLESGRIPYRRLGSHRRILVRDLLAFKSLSDRDREVALRRLTEEAQELGLGY